MSEARFSCGHAAMITLNNLARLHDLIESKAKDRSAEKALEKAQTESASRDMETLRLRPADGWARVLGRLKDFFVEGKTTPVVSYWQYMHSAVSSSYCSGETLRSLFRRPRG